MKPFLFRRKETDVCLVAVLGGKSIGAVWTRVFPETEKGYGYVDPLTPELSMSVAPPYRQQGTGTRLLQTMIEKLIQLGYHQVSLSVDKLNYASAWYPKFGFETVEQNGESVTMVKRLKNNPQTKKLLMSRLPDRKSPCQASWEKC